ncbi:hypothetical protein [Nocardia sp. NPDC051750]|uniref:hypothetical protein n=1 Tax=Nocardia sp. NPDC051750 TaxID=3364325 RepID=UPI00379A4F78
MFTVFPGCLGAVAAAQDGTTVTNSTRTDGLAWMNIRDSAGVALADYVFVSDQGGLLDPGATAVWAIVGLEFVGYMIIVTTAIWFIGYALSFAWLDLFAGALRGTADALAAQIATPIVMVTAATVGAFFVAWFLVRGFPARAGIQVVTMLCVAVGAPLFLAAPLAGVLDSDGMLARGRDVGLAVAAGLNGSANRDPDLMLSTLQADMADNFARRPVQVWNFGHIVDNNATCEAAWSAGVAAGDSERTQRALDACGDADAAAAAAHPAVGQIGTGLILLVSALVLLLFAVILAVRLIKAALDTIYQGFMAVFGFAAGGFIYGPTQTFLVRNLAGTCVAAARMCAYTVFVGVYLVFLGGLFQQARDQVVAVLVISAAVVLVAIAQMNRLSRSLTRGSNWTTNRIALALQGRSGSSGGAAIGMGGGGGSGGGSTGGMLASLAVLSTVNRSPLTAWLAGGVIGPLDPLARKQMHSMRANAATAGSRVEGHRWQTMARQNWRVLARREADAWGGIETELGLNRALKYLDNNKVPADATVAALIDAGADGIRVDNHIWAKQVRDDTRSRSPYGFRPLQQAAASGNAAIHFLGDDAAPAFAAQAVSDADSLARHTRTPDPTAPIDRAFVARVRQNWDSDRALRAAITPDEWNRVGRNTRTVIADELARDHLAAARAFYENPSDVRSQDLLASIKRLTNLDHATPALGLDPWDP